VVFNIIVGGNSALLRQFPYVQPLPRFALKNKLR